MTIEKRELGKWSLVNALAAFAIYLILNGLAYAISWPSYITRSLDIFMTSSIIFKGVSEGIYYSGNHGTPILVLLFISMILPFALATARPIRQTVDVTEKSDKPFYVKERDQQ